VYTAIIQISYPVGCVLSSFVTDRIDRKWGMAIFYTLNMFSGVAFFFSSSVPMIIFFGFLTELLIFIDGPLLHTYEVEIYPTDLRGRGSGTSFAFSRLGGFLAPLAATVMLAVAGSAGSSLLIATAAGSWLLCATTAAVLAVKTGKATLEDLEQLSRRTNPIEFLTAEPTELQTTKAG